MKLRANEFDSKFYFKYSKLLMNMSHPPLHFPSFLFKHKIN